jgi:hypothetical protein
VAQWLGARSSKSGSGWQSFISSLTDSSEITAPGC